MNGNPFYILEGVLCVNAKGYWFTSGGDKGSFGYYPHLKDEKNYPVFPDTQIHGDLRVAAAWINSLCGEKYKSLIDRLFGKEGNNASSLLHMTDLFLTAESAKQWDDAGSANGFQVKTRIEIEDGTRVNKELMLVNLELSYLDSLTLEAKVYAGYFANKEDADVSQTILKKCLPLISGFGAFRSRGYGRGNVSLELTCTQVSLDEKAEPPDQPVPYFLENLVNFRNKPVEPGKTQLAESLKWVSAEQLRGWFARTYNDVFDEWPTYREMGLITFPNLYCSIREGQTMGYPAPMSTLRDEDWMIKDMHLPVKDADGTDKVDKEGRENFFNTKTKPLPDTMFVTNETPPRIVEVKTEKRMRNSMDDKFVTKENGLFVQEHVKAGNTLGGMLVIKNDGSDFIKRAWSILKEVKPVINGAIFEQHVILDETKTGSTSEAVEESPKKIPNLVINPLPFEETYFAPPPLEPNQINLGTIRQFNTMLMRPRRNRIAIVQQSVINDFVENATVSWSGFREEIEYQPKDRNGKGTEGESENPVDIKTPYRISRAQAGLLRELLRHNRDIGEMKFIVSRTLEKCQKQGDKDRTKLYTSILTYLDGNDREGMRTFIETTLHDLALGWWQEKNKKGLKKKDERTEG